MRSTSSPSRRNTLKPNISTRPAAAPEAAPEVGIEVAAETMNARLQPMRRRKAPIVAWAHAKRGPRLAKAHPSSIPDRMRSSQPRGRVPARAARSGEPEVATLQTVQGHVLQHNGVVRIEADDRIMALLLAESEDRLEVGVGQYCVIELDVIALLEVGDDVLPEGGGKHERVGTLAASQGVISTTAVQRVIVVAAGKHIIAAPTEQRIVAIAARHGVVAVAAFEMIIPVRAGNAVIAERSGEVVVSVAAVEGCAGLGDVRHGDINHLRAGGT